MLLKDARQAMYICRTIEARSRNHCCSGKAINITYSQCVCSPKYPASNAHALYCHLWHAQLYNVFPHHYMKGTKTKKLLNLKCVFSFSLFRLSETFLVLRRNEWGVIKKYVSVFIYSTRYYCKILIKLEFSLQIFGKFSNIKFL
jgi:hypothetical protein